MEHELIVNDSAGVRWIEINRPDSKNGLTSELNRRLIAALQAVDEESSTRVVVLTGAGGSFCSGLDLKYAMSSGLTGAGALEKHLREDFHGLIRAVRAVGVPVIAAVDGTAVGFGCDLAMACDIRLASDRARFGEVFVKRGLMPDGGGSFMLSRIVGLGRALEILYTGDLVDASEAYRIGLANRVIPVAGFRDAVATFAETLARGAPLALRLIKQATHAALSGDLDAALDREASGQMQCLRSADFQEGLQAFLAKREPRFQGK
jgi:enoyl-CoA hydratase/carnithine racemase